MADNKNLINTIYKIGGVDSSKPLPVGVTISLDPEVKKILIYTGVGIGIGIGVGIGVGYFIAKTLVLVNKKRRRYVRK